MSYRRPVAPLTAIAAFVLGVWLTPRYDITPLDVPYVLKPRCSIFRVGTVSRMSDEEMRRPYPDAPASKSGTWTVIKGWGIDCTSTLGQGAVLDVEDGNMKSGGYTVEELELIERLSKTDVSHYRVSTVDEWETREVDASKPIKVRP